MKKVRASKRDLEIFMEACEKLAHLANRGLHVYLANDTLCLMGGPSHDDKTGQPLRDNVIVSHLVPGASGGDW